MAASDSYRRLGGQPTIVREVVVVDVRALLCTVLLFLLSGLAVAGGAATGWPPWTPIGRGGGMSVPGGSNAAAVVIPSRKALDRYPVLTMHPAHPPCSSPCEWYERFDWKHDAVLLVVAHMPGEFDIYALARRGSALHVTVGPRYPGQPAFPIPVTLWMTVEVRKRLLGLPLPHEVVVATKFPPAGQLAAAQARSGRSQLGAWPRGAAPVPAAALSRRLRCWLHGTSNPGRCGIPVPR